MASKYAALAGTVPENETEREEAVNKHLLLWETSTLPELTSMHNTESVLKADLSAKHDAVKARVDALEILIRKALNALEAESISMNGRTWSNKYEPFAVAEDPAAIVQYFKDHNMEDQLALSNSELAARLKAFVKNEALAGELKVETVPDPATGGTKVEVRSQIPGVLVFLKPGLSHPKSGKGGGS